MNPHFSLIDVCSDVLGVAVIVMVEMFNRSEESKLRYTAYVGDGDSVVETALKTEVLYGPLINHKVKVMCKEMVDDVKL